MELLLRQHLGERYNSFLSIIDIFFLIFKAWKNLPFSQFLVTAGEFCLILFHFPLLLYARTHTMYGYVLLSNCLFTRSIFVSMWCEQESNIAILFSIIFQGLCHISELSSDWLAKAEDVSRSSFTLVLFGFSLCRSCLFMFLFIILLQAFRVGDRIDVKLIEVLFGPS